MLKIDRSFVMKMATSPEDAMIVGSRIDLGRNPGLRMATEGIGTDELAPRASGTLARRTTPPSTTAPAV